MANNIFADHELEKKILGTIINYNYLADFNKLNDSMFDDNRHKYLFAAIKKRYEDGKSIDLVELVEDLKKSNNINQVGGMSYITDITTGKFMPTNFETLYLSLKELNIRRKIRDCGLKIYGDSGNPDRDPLTLLDELIETGEKISNETFSGLVEEPLLTSAKKTVDNIIYRQTNKESGIYTGFTSMDKYMGGLIDGRLYILGARPAMGKTSLALSMAYEIISAAKNILLFSLEMTKEDLIKKLLAFNTGISPTKMDNLQTTDDENYRLTTAALQIGALNLTICDESNINMKFIQAYSRSMHAKGRCEMIIIDYMQLIRSQKDRNKTVNDLISENSQALKRLAKSLNVPVLVLAQLNREVDKRSDKRPLLSDLRDSGGIEQDADVVMFLYRPNYYDTAANENLAIVTIAKNRHGKTFETELNFDKNTTRFSNYNDAPNKYEELGDKSDFKTFLEP